MKKPIFLATLLSILFFSLSLLLGIYLFIRSYVMEAQSLHNDMMENYTQIITETEKGVRYLRELGLGHGTCSPRLLLEMRRVQYSSESIRDIGYLQNNILLCSSGLGKLPKPIPESEPEFRGLNGERIWLNEPLQLFDGTVTGHIVQVGNFNFVYNAAEFKSQRLGPISSHGYVHHTGGFTFLAPVSPRHPRPNMQQKPLMELHGLTYQAYECIRGNLLCHYTVLSIPKVFEHKKALLFGLIFFLLITSFLLYDLIHRRLVRYFSLESQIPRSLSYERIICLYQPQVSLIDAPGKVIGAEALVRFVADDGTLITPDRFLGTVRQKKLTQKLTELVISHVQADYARFFQTLDYKGDFKIAINIFARDFTHDTMLELFSRCNIKQHDICLCFEVVEDELVELESARSTVNLIQDSRYTFAVDDFGTGYSNLQYIKELSPDIIKIDRSFVQGIDSPDSVRALMIKSLIEMLHHAGASIVAEGVENAKQSELLTSYGVEVGQGYLFGKPMSAEDLAQRITLNPK